MPPQGKTGDTAGEKDRSNEAVVVRVPAKYRTYLTEKGEGMADAVEASTGARPAFNPSGVVEALIRADQKRQAETPPASA